MLFFSWCWFYVFSYKNHIVNHIHINLNIFVSHESNLFSIHFGYFFLFVAVSYASIAIFLFWHNVDFPHSVSQYWSICSAKKKKKNNVFLNAQWTSSPHHQTHNHHRDGYDCVEYKELGISYGFTFFFNKNLLIASHDFCMCNFLYIQIV